MDYVNEWEDILKIERRYLLFNFEEC